MGVEMAKKTSKQFKWAVCLIIFLFCIVIGFEAAFGWSVLSYLNSPKTEVAYNVTEEQPDPPQIDPEVEEPPEEIDFQPVVDSWVAATRGNKSIMIYDLALKHVVGAYNVESEYNIASLYKLFVVYEGYRRVSNGEWDGSSQAGYTGKTIIECLDLAIRESNSDCGETLWSMIGRGTLDDIIANEWTIVSSAISKLVSNPNDIMLMMKRFYDHPDFNNQELLSRMWDSFLNQPVTEYDWRQGLPSGFSKASVYNKVGWNYLPDEEYWEIYHDAAIVKFPLENGKTRDFVVVVMTDEIDFRNIRKFGEMLEEKFYEGKI